MRVYRLGFCDAEFVGENFAVRGFGFRIKSSSVEHLVCSIASPVASLILQASIILRGLRVVGFGISV